jgi:hypothetical protein
MKIYREHEVVDLLKIVAIDQGREITTAEAQAAIERYRLAVNEQHSNYPWILSLWDKVTVNLPDRGPMAGEIVKVHLMHKHGDITITVARYDVDITFATAERLETVRMYNLHPVYIQLEN